MGILLGLAIAAGIIGGAKLHMNASKNNKATKEIFDRHAYEIECADNKLESAKGSFYNRIESLGDTKRTILTDQFEEYIEIMRCFKKVEYDRNDKLADYKDIRDKIDMISIAVESPKYKRYFPECTAIAAVGAYGVASICYMLANNLTLSACFGASSAASILSFAGGGIGIASSIAGGIALGGIALGGGLLLSGLISQCTSKNNLEKAIEFERNLPVIIAENDRNCMILDHMSAFITNWSSSLKKLSKTHMKSLNDANKVKEKYSNSFLNKIRRIFKLQPSINYKKLTDEEKHKIYRCKELSNVLYEVLSFDVFDANGNVAQKNYEKMDSYNLKAIAG